MNWEQVFLTCTTSLGLAGMGYVFANYAQLAMNRLRCNYLERSSVPLSVRALALGCQICYRLIFLAMALMGVIGLVGFVISSFMLTVGFCWWLATPVMSVPPTPVF